MKKRVTKVVTFIVATIFVVSLIGCERKQKPKNLVVPEKETNTNKETKPKLEYKYKDSKVSIDLPEGWEYETEEEELRIWPAGCEEGKITILYHEDLFGVCGTGLQTKKITLGGQEASQGTYDGDKMWSFIIFSDESIPYVIRSDGASVWWDEYGEEAMEILDTIKF